MRGGVDQVVERGERCHREWVRGRGVVQPRGQRE
jgi:hypothetical protein